MKAKQTQLLLIALISLVLSILSVSAVADFAVTSFSCTPSEVSITNVFSCTAQITNNGDAAGSVSVATLYPDSNDWLESSNYPQASGASVDPGQSTEVSFIGLRATKSGDNGFSRITLDDVTDTYPADNNVKTNVIDVAVTVANSVSSASMGGSFNSVAEVTAGGNIDVTLTLAISSGGCSIGSQDSQKTINSMQNGNKQSRTWAVTQGTSGSCKFTITAAAVGTDSLASKTDSSASTITCTDCPVSSSSSSSSSSTGGGGSSGGGGGGSSAAYTLGELTTAQKTLELYADSFARFNLSNVEHTLTVVNISDTQAIITIKSTPQTLVLTVGEEKSFDLDSNGELDLSVKLKSINYITKKATILISSKSGKVEKTAEAGSKASDDGQQGETTRQPLSRGSKTLIYFVVAVAVIGLIVTLVYLYLHRKNRVHY